MQFSKTRALNTDANINLRWSKIALYSIELQFKKGA